MASGASLLAGLDAAGNFLIVDSLGGVDDSVTIYRDGDQIVAFSEAGVEADGVGEEGDNTVSVIASQITGRIIVDLKGGSNSLLVTWNNAAPTGGPETAVAGDDPTVAGGITYIVTGDVDADDSLVVSPPAESPVTVDYSTAIVPRYSGTVRVGGAAGAVRFQNVVNSEGPTLTLEGSETVTFNLPGLGDAGELGITDSDGPGNIMLSSKRLAGPSFASTVIATEGPVAVTVNMGRDNGVFTVAAVRGDEEISDIVTVNGDGGSDRITVGVTGSPVTVGVTLNGGDGNDTLVGSNGEDTLNGGAGEDVLRGGNGDDTLGGGAGRDQLFGESGDDLLNGDQGDDTIEGGLGDDSLVGGLGNDTLNGGLGIDEIRGNEGTDVIRVRGAEAVFEDASDDMDGGGGTDTLEFIGDVNVVLANFGGADDLTASIERINGRRLALVGTADSNVFDLSRVTAVSLIGIYGLAGDDTIIGTSGVDTIYGNSPTPAAGDYDDNDSIAGGGGNDKLYGGAGDDTLRGEAGNDTINGGQGEDSISGGVGNDLIETSGTESEMDAISGDVGNDTLANIGTTAMVLDGFDAGENDLETIRGNGEDITGNEGDNTLDFRRSSFASVALVQVTAVRGGDGDDTIYGSTAADRLFGDDGDDLLVGGSGNDYLDGGDGDDSLSGGGGLDTLFGGLGEDVLTGGDSFDIFAFKSSADNLDIDLVTDYRNDYLQYEGFARGEYSTDYAAIQSTPTADGLRLTQSASGKKVVLAGGLTTKPARSRFLFREASTPPT
jgi:Ca2+-binding RTX toxin-like protein